MVDEGAPARALVQLTAAEVIARGGMIGGLTIAVGRLGEVVADLHGMIPLLVPEDLRGVYRGAGQLERRAWELQAHAVHEALGRPTYGAGSADRIVAEWGISRSRVYQLRDIWTVRRLFEGRDDILAVLTEARWWQLAAAANTEGRDAEEWIAYAAREHRATSGWSTHEFYRAIRAYGISRAVRARTEEQLATISGEAHEYVRARLDRIEERQAAALPSVVPASDEEEEGDRPEVSSLLPSGRRNPAYGKGSYPGSMNGDRLIDLWLYLGFPQRVLDPMAGGDTTGDVCRALGIEYEGYDLRHPFESSTLHHLFDSTTTPIPGEFDFILWHPPYEALMDYRRGEHDLSRADDHDAWLVRYRAAFEKFWSQNLTPGGRIAVLMGDARRGGRYLPLCAQTALLAPQHVETILILTHGDQLSSTSAGPGTIAIVHEELVVFKKPRSEAAATNRDLPPHQPGENGPVPPPDRWPGPPRRGGG